MSRSFACVTLVIAFTIASVVAGTASAAPPASAAPALPGESVYRLDARLTDQSGRRFALAEQRGKARVVVMFYTGCKFICPTIIDTVKDLDRKLQPADRQRLGVLLISLDPAHDNPKALKATAVQRGLDLTRWTLAQPQASDVRAIAGLLGVRYRPLDDGDINHTGVLVLLDAQGRVVARSEQTSGAVEARFLAQVRALLAQPPAAGALVGAAKADRRSASARTMACASAPRSNGLCSHSASPTS